MRPAALVVAAGHADGAPGFVVSDFVGASGFVVAGFVASGFSRTMRSRV